MHRIELQMIFPTGEYSQNKEVSRLVSVDLVESQAS
jgi:hypothetical protein